MATVEFKQSLLDTALAMGTVVKVGDKYQSTTTDAQGKISDLFTATSMFNDSLSSQWMTTDVLVQTLGNYATDVREMTAAEKKAYEEKLRLYRIIKRNSCICKFSNARSHIRKRINGFIRIGIQFFKVAIYCLDIRPRTCHDSLHGPHFEFILCKSLMNCRDAV